MASDDFDKLTSPWLLERFSDLLGERRQPDIHGFIKEDESDEGSLGDESVTCFGQVPVS
jgi:hypothetical protein